MRNKLTWLGRNKVKSIKVARVKQITADYIACISRRPKVTPRKREGKKRNNPRRPPGPTFSQPPPQRLAEIRQMTQTEKHPHKSTPQQRRNTPTPNTKEQDTTTTKGRGERSAKRPAHEIAPDTVPCVLSSENSYIHKTLN